MRDVVARSVLGNNLKAVYPKQMHPISPGEIIDVVAPASACSRQELMGGVQMLKELGLRPRVPRGILSREAGLFANTDAKRLAFLKRAVYASDSGMIWCLRGGYGSLRLMPEIQTWKRPARAKIFLGFSDITSLHVHLNQKWNWPTLHGPMLARLGRGPLAPREHAELFGLLFGQKTQVTFSRLKPLNAESRRAGVIHASILGGNMAVLQSGLGTPSALVPKGCLLYLEDLNEKPHRVDRMLTQFAQAGWFGHCRGVLLGDFLMNDAQESRLLWRDVLPRFARAVGVPVVAGVPVGHDPRRNRTLPFNTSARLQLGARPELVVDSGIDPG